MACPATDVAVADTATKGATDAAVGAGAADVGATSLGGAAALDAGTALAGAGAADALAGGATATLPEVTVTGTAPSGVSGVLPAAVGVGATALGGGGAPSVPHQAADTGAYFLTATGPSDVQSLTPSLASTLGVDTGPADQGFIGLAGEDTPLPGDVAADVPTAGYANPDSAAPDQGGMLDWLKNPKNALTAGMLGISGINALSKPQLPGAAKTALGAAGPAVQQAESVIQSGGTATPAWTQQKASIDASIDEQIKNETAALQQTLVNEGAGGANSGIVQEQIATVKANLEAKRQALYLQAQQQNVSNAVSELTGANQTLMALAELQFQEDQGARQSAFDTARLAAMLQSLQV